MRWIIAGAGSIGCWIGGHLAAHGDHVSLVGRPRLFEAIGNHGLNLTSLDEPNPVLVDADILKFLTALPEDTQADTVIVCVKSRDTQAMAKALAVANLPAACSIISAQNGMRNAETLQQMLPDHAVYPMIVPYNVVNLGKAHYHRGTQGELELPLAASALRTQLSRAGLTTRCVPDITSRMWGKLLMNLSNPINALADIPLRDQLLSRTWRRRLAECLIEAMAVLKAAGIKPDLPLPLPGFLVTRIMQLPTPLYRLAAASTLKIDPMARSSMWEDIQARRPTEIDYISGEVVRLGMQHGVPTPKNNEVITQIRALEASHGITSALWQKR